MRIVQNGFQAMSLLIDLGFDRIIYALGIAVALTLGATLGQSILH